MEIAILILLFCFVGFLGYCQYKNGMRTTQAIEAFLKNEKPFKTNGVKKKTYFNQIPDTDTGPRYHK